MTDANAPLVLPRGPNWRHRIGLAPLTNLQSHPDGTLSDDEFGWLVKRAEGGFAMVMTCASHVQAAGQGFPGQLGIWGDHHLPGLTRLASAIKAHGSVAIVQLHHAGRRSPADLIGTQPVCAFDDPETGALALTAGEIEATIEAFIAAGLRAQAAGFDGVEVHGAHGYLVGQFLDSENNHRTDGWGATARGRAAFLWAILRGLRERTRPDFQIGVRLSPERFGIDTLACRELCGALMASGLIDFLDLSLWDTFKAPMSEDLAGRPLLGWFTDLPRHGVALGVAGRIGTAASIREALALGADFVLPGRAGVLHHDLPAKVFADEGFEPRPLPVSRETLAAEALGPAFIDYMAGWKGFVA